MIKILHVITGLHTGGAEKMLHKLLQSLPRERFESQVVSLKRGGALVEDIQSLGVPVEFLDVDGILSAFFSLPRLKTIIAKYNPTLVHSWMYHANTLCHFALKNSERPLFWGIRYSLHDISELKWSTQQLIKWGSYFSKHPNKIIYNSFTSAEQHEAIGYNPDSRVVIGNGIDSTQWFHAPPSDFRKKYGLSPEDYIVAMVARYDPQKDVPSFIQAARLFQKKFPRAHFFLIGPGFFEDNEELKKLIRIHAVGQFIHLFGEKKDVRPILSEVDLFTLTSKNGEAFPNVLLEAMAMALPMVATDVGDCRRLLDGVGITVPPGQPTLLVQAWEKVLRMSPEEKDKLRQNGLNRIRNEYSLETISKQYQDLYQSVLR